MEDEGGQGYIFDHFESYFAKGDLMTSDYLNNPSIVSLLTLAALNDTGWYVA